MRVIAEEGSAPAVSCRIQPSAPIDDMSTGQGKKFSGRPWVTQKLFFLPGLPLVPAVTGRLFRSQNTRAYEAGHDAGLRLVPVS